MSGQQSLKTSPSPAQEPHSDDQIALRPFQVGEPIPRRMSVTDMCRAFAVDGHPMDRSTFHRNERAGKFERFELKPQVGHKAWSGTLVARYLDCEAGASRFVTVGSSHKRNLRAVPSSTVSPISGQKGS